MTWPPIATALLARMDGPHLDQIIATVTQLLTRFTLPDSSVVVIPVQGGVPLLRYAVRVFVGGSAYPFLDEADAWLDLIPATQPMPCSDAVADAVEALRELSSLAWLETQRSVGASVQEAVDSAVDRLRDAMSRLDALPRDAVTAQLIEVIDELADCVQGEVDDHATQGVLAEVLAGGLTGDGNEVFVNVVGLVYVATRWDLDLARARELLERAATRSRGGRAANPWQRRLSRERVLAASVAPATSPPRTLPRSRCTPT